MMKMKWVNLLKINIKWYILLIILTILHICIQSFFPYQVKIIIDDVFGKKNYSLLNEILFYTILIALISGILEFVKSIIITYTSEKTVAIFKTQMFKHIRNLPFSFYETKETGEIISILQNDTMWLSHLLKWTFPSMIQVFFQILINFFILFTLSWKLAIFSIVIMPIPFLLSYLFSKPIKTTAQLVQECLGKQTKELEESIKASQEIIVFNRKEWNTKRLQDLFYKIIPLEMKSSYFRSISLSLNMIVYWIIFAFLYWFGGKLIQSDQISLGTMIAFISYLNTLFGPLNQLSIIYTDIQSAIGGIKQALDLMNIKHEEKVNDHIDNNISCHGDIKLENISFSYDGQNEVLKNISCTIPKGKITAIVGESGTGKSSLLKIICGLYMPTEGKILIGDQCIDPNNIEYIRDGMAIVFQNSHFFSGTVFENICFGDNSISERKVREACEIAEAHDFIINLRNGYQTLIGEDGLRLSGGQKQRIAIARALVRKPDILILDEATSALDPNTERLINRNIMEKFKDKMTIIMIAHRIESIKNADNILVLKNGRIVESGTYDQLMSLKGEFYRIYSLERVEKVKENTLYTL